MARAHAKSYRPGPPIVPQVIVNKLVNYIAKIHVGKKQPFIERLCRYWSLKREARRGAPLLKRLHLEPWTASTESREQTDAEKAKKLEFLVALRNDLEKVRLLAELVRKREKEKLRQAQVIQDTVDSFVFPHYVTLRSVFNRIVAMDREEVFVHPVDTSEVPDYLDVVKEPMCFAAMEDKLDRIAYTSVEEFKVSDACFYGTNRSATFFSSSTMPCYITDRRHHSTAVLRGSRQMPSTYWLNWTTSPLRLRLCLMRINKSSQRQVSVTWNPLSCGSSRYLRMIPTPRVAITFDLSSCRKRVQSPRPPLLHQRQERESQEVTRRGKHSGRPGKPSMQRGYHWGAREQLAPLLTVSLQSLRRQSSSTLSRRGQRASQDGENQRASRAHEGQRLWRKHNPLLPRLGRSNPCHVLSAEFWDSRLSRW